MGRIIPLLLSLLLLCGCAPDSGSRVPAPDDADRLVIFTASSAAVYDDAVREFERRTGIWVEVRTADGTLPLLEEIAAGGSGCDLLLGAAPDVLTAYAGCFAPYASPLAADIAAAYRDGEDRWTPFSLLPLALVYNDQLVQRNVPDCWADLLSPAWRGRVAYPPWAIPPCRRCFRPAARRKPCCPRCTATAAYCPPQPPWWRPWPMAAAMWA